MSIFPHFPKESKCLICGTNEDQPCALIPLMGTKQGNNVEAIPIHMSCVCQIVVITEDGNLIAGRLPVPYTKDIEIIE